MASKGAPDPQTGVDMHLPAPIESSKKNKQGFFSRPKWVSKKAALVLYPFLALVILSLISMARQSPFGPQSAPIPINSSTEPSQPPQDNYSDLLKPETEKASKPEPEKKYSQDYELGGYKDRFSLTVKETDKHKYNLNFNGVTIATIESVQTPYITVFNNGDLRFVLQRHTGQNAEFLIVNLDGSMKSVLTESDDVVYLLSTKSISRDNDKLIYSRVSAHKQGCGGEGEFKTPNFNGPILEMRYFDLKTSKDYMILKDERKPLANVAEQIFAGLDIIGYGVDDSKLYARKRSGGCGGLETVQTYEIDLAPNGKVTQIPYTQTIPAKPDDIYIYPIDISPDGRYLMYQEALHAGDNDKVVIHQFDLQTRKDNIILNK